jgi:hypothetical protein
MFRVSFQVRVKFSTPENALTFIKFLKGITNALLFMNEILFNVTQSMYQLDAPIPLLFI